MKYAYNNNGILQDVVMNHPARLFPLQYADLFIIVPDDAEDGWLWNGETAVPPPPAPPPIPKSITRAQAIAALILSGLDDQIQPAIDSIEDPIQRKLAQNDFDNRLTFERTNPTLIALAGMLGMTEAQLDELFVLGATL